MSNLPEPGSIANRMIEAGDYRARRASKFPHENEPGSLRAGNNSLPQAGLSQQAINDGAVAHYLWFWHAITDEERARIVAEKGNANDRD